MARLSILLFLTFTIASLFIPGVLSQAPPCVVACLAASAASFGCSPTDANCVCSSDAIANAVASCIVNQCSISDAQAAEGFFTNFCSGATSPSGSFSVEPSTMESTAAPSNSFESTASLGPTGSSGTQSLELTGSLTPSGSPTLSEPTSGPATSATGSPTSPTSQRASTAPASSASTNTSGSSRPSSTTSTTPTPVNHAEGGPTAGSFTKIGFALALALAAW